MLDVIALVLLLALGGLIVVVVGAGVIFGADLLQKYLENERDY
jgi:hypothetical protein